MAITPLKVLFFIAGMVVFGVGTAYFAGAFDPAAQGAGEKTAALDAGDAGAGASSTRRDEGTSAGAGAPEEAEGASKDDAEARPEEEVVVPSFDVLRVEPDGSMVVAGGAAPGAEVEVLSGSMLLATTKAGPSGDFAAVLDQALTPGEHNIVLRSTSSDNVAATSEETAVVSIPSAGSGQVVALVQQPGQPSRLITRPEGEAPAGDVPEAAQSAEAEGEPAEAQAPSGEQATAPDGDEDAGQTGEMAERSSDATDDRPGETTPAEERVGPIAEAQSDEAAGTAGSAGEGQDAPARAAEAPAQEGQDAQAAEADGSEQEAPADTGVSAFIEAVEIDGRQVFVAGTAEPGRHVRVYVNDVLLGQTTVNPDGSFLVETERDLPVGDYIVRADVLGDDDASVIARAAVPFQRQEGEQIAAVAPDPNRRIRTDAKAEMPGTGTADDSADAAVNGNRREAAENGDRRTAEAGESGQDVAPSVGETAEMAPPLEPVDGAVIIRRGDTLWHISRRVYGHGIRYTTIYLANQDQIRDPDRIWPGQIFALPEKTEQGEEADLGAIGEQAVPPEEARDEEG
ncbi:LysM peptidoglycan-binding domain-containing protein [Chelativorans salis]|uniref:LysM peptidoglycan-binding domain-containing protein n=1 Tax=Chelativorans salis TaxID=2978478 RepID=A0ABT2LNU4_9HYPH|nr:LysM peptidoglycan-binding domain-containing protein [Chelativorans sp. EGI FJ00035]MCT7375961.1 LysM peptidoglycan-binding domain-containing protein [Chelativorans sp. EGI FJ00035]